MVPGPAAGLGRRTRVHGHDLVETWLVDADTRHPASAAAVGGGSMFVLGDAGQWVGAHRERGGTLHAYGALTRPREWFDGLDLADPARVVAEFEGWAPELTALVTDGDVTPVLRPLHRLPAGHRWERVPGVTLLGDAAHLAPPDGEGANLAMQDGAELARSLVAHGDDVEAALTAYEQALFPAPSLPLPPRRPSRSSLPRRSSPPCAPTHGPPEMPAHTAPGRTSAVPAHPQIVRTMHTTPPSPSPGPPAIEVEDLVRSFGDVRAVDGISFTAQRGQVLGLLGPNGSGKTTTVRMLATLLPPTGGRASVLGHDVVADAAAVRGRIGLTGQYAAVDEALTGRDNLYLIGRLLDLSRRDARARAERLVEQFGLVEAAGRRAKTYSGGMRRRLDLAASLVGRPEVLFLDEPTTGLDPHHRNEVWEAVRRLSEDGVTVLLTTQYLEEADQLAHDLVVLDRGVVIAAGTAAELKSRAGGRRLHVRPEAPQEAALVAAIVASDTGVEPTVAPSGEVVVATPDPGALRRVEERLAVAGVAVAEIGLRLPSLDDVFLSLTGHDAETTDRGAA